jgi:hypothetical protein
MSFHLGQKKDIGMTSSQARPGLQAFDLRCWELAGGSNPQPAVYKTAADRPPRTGACSPCSSRRMGCPASALQWAE